MIVNRITSSKIFGVSESTMRNYMQEGMPHTSAGVRGGKCEIDTVKAHKWLIEREIRNRGYSTGEGGEEEGDISAERKKLIIEQTRKHQIENDEAERLLVPLEDVRVACSAAITELAGLLDGAAGKMSSGDAVLRQKLFDEHRRIRELFADRLESIVDVAGSSELDEAAAEEGGVAMGEG